MLEEPHACSISLRDDLVQQTYTFNACGESAREVGFRMVLGVDRCGVSRVIMFRAGAGVRPRWDMRSIFDKFYT